ncbi:hypothetical protein TRIATDRAFT_300602 [Trichoderma atroviride IMI 206040]|uniref:Uncharacterized protein n=1 Tax=Hypocrea atroviridis (strain ATCC 20476 / IMI 206040) TaxID=452589 RepID=G9NY43_HYPAI|nr:uncharacterized protein TRIATDRAFT_300602 [Trichoderma atroviride IMI 206040]EHK44371.1 hypothetical protein TRIATDRAFT_300602 [Trichoderma atroviride IMI 206040]
MSQLAHHHKTHSSTNLASHNVRCVAAQLRAMYANVKKLSFSLFFNPIPCLRLKVMS